MTDLNVPTFRHSGSTISYNGNAMSRGAVDYIGPCPSRGERHNYCWTVKHSTPRTRFSAKEALKQHFHLNVFAAVSAFGGNRPCRHAPISASDPKRTLQAPS